MDVRAFGSYYGQTAVLSYASGLALSPSGQSFNFPACRAVLINGGTSNQDLQVFFTDGTNTPVILKKVPAGSILPISITAISGAATTVGDVVILY
jgi:hypothetical protein